jgi:DNA modification methylase
MQNQLYYGDNLDVLRNFIADESVDLCYIDPPFNSNRDYNQIYTNPTGEDQAQAQAFADTWTWTAAAADIYNEIVPTDHHNQPISIDADTPLTNPKYTVQTINLTIGLRSVLGKSPLFAYILNMTQRIAEIHRTLKPTGSFYLHCDPTASHYLKLVCDGIFCPTGGAFLNEIKWVRSGQHNLAKRRFDNVLDTIFFYTKNASKFTFIQSLTQISEEERSKKFPNTEPETGRKFQHRNLEKSSNRQSKDEIRTIQGREVRTDLGWVWSQQTFDERLAANPHLIYWTGTGKPRYKIYADEYEGRLITNDWNDIKGLTSQAKERLGYPTQKPEALLERIVQASSNAGDVIMDAYCGCGTTIAVAQKLDRKWIGVDITYQSISLILKRLEDSFGNDFAQDVVDKSTAQRPTRLLLSGVPHDFESAVALAHKQDDRTRKEFEKWAVLSYSKNRAVINEKKGGDGGIDGIAYMIDYDVNNKQIYRQILFSVKTSKTLTPSVIRDLAGTMERENAALGVFITLYPMPNLVKEAQKYGTYTSKMFGTTHPKIEVIDMEQYFDEYKRLNIPTADVLKSAERNTQNPNQNELEFE